MRLHFLTACAALLGIAIQTAPVQAGEAYIGGQVLGAISYNDFGGINTLGRFGNNDSVNETLAGIALTFGLRDQLKLGNMAITPEIEAAWYQNYNITSASFPGRPTPMFFYRSKVKTGRLGLNLWTPFYADGLWRAEAGAGFGVLYRDFKTNDNVVGGSDDDFALYGKLGVRLLRQVGQRGKLTLGANYIASSRTNISLAGIGSGIPAGNLSVKTNGPEISIGYQLSLGNFGN